MRVLATVALSIALAALGRAQVGSSPYPIRAVSPSGEWVLTVEGTNRSGIGTGSCRLERNGGLAWKAELPFTFTDAAVTDGGITAGYWSHWLSGSTYFAVLGEVGAFRLREERKRPVPRGSFVVSSDPTPIRFLLPDEANDRVIFRVAGQWAVYRLSDGSHVHERDPLAVPPSGFDAESLVQRGWSAVPDTELVLADWYDSSSSEPEPSVYFALFDRDLRPVWSFVVPNAGKEPSDEEVRMAEVFDFVGTQIVDVAPGGAFTLAVIETGERIAFCAVRDERLPSGWRVDELERQALDVPPPDSVAEERRRIEELPRIELELLARVPLRSGDAASETDRELVSKLPGNLGTATVDSLGRLLVRDTRTSSVHGFDPNGVQILVARPSPGDFKLHAPSVVDRGLLSVSPSGDIFYAWKVPFQGTSTTKLRTLHFAPDGRRIGLEPSLGLHRDVEYWFWQPKAERRWIVTSDRLHWIDDATGERRDYHQGPDGRSFGIFDHSDVRVGADGSLALTTETRDERGRERYCVHLFTADGEPLRTLLLHGHGYGTWEFQYTGDRLLFPAAGDEWIALDLAGAPLARYVLSALPQELDLESVFVALGRELWVVAREERELWRFALP